MAQRTKLVQASRYQLWRSLRYTAWLAFPLTFWRAWNGVSAEFRAAVAGVENPLLGFVAAATILSLTVFLAGFVPFFVWWCVCTFFMSRARREASFVPTRDLEYYRERLHGLTAAQVSMLADLRIEPQEDAVATLLALMLRGVVGEEDGRICVRDEAAVQRLSQGDRLLVQQTCAGDLSASACERWAQLAEREAADGVHLRSLGVSKGSKSAVGCAFFLRGCGMGCLTIVAISLLFQLYSVTIGRELMALFDTIESDYEMVPLMIENPMLMVQLLIMVGIAMVLAIGIVLPLVETVRGLVENGDASRRFRRTALGEEEAEYVYGIRNYLRDFTALSDADRKALVLWDDFLVYAVALGQNRKVVRELLALRHVDAAFLG